MKITTEVVEMTIRHRYCTCPRVGIGKNSPSKLWLKASRKVVRRALVTLLLGARADLTFQNEDEFITLDTHFGEAKPEFPATEKASHIFKYLNSH